MTAITREIPLYTLEGVKNAEISTHPFETGDKLGLSLLRFQQAACDDVVLIIHGLTTSTDMFIMPEHYNLVQYLLDHGFTDVWTLDFRMSNRHSYNLRQHRYNMDDIALFDHPAAVAKIREYIGDRRLHVICHCLGSASFTMSLFGKAVTGITSVIANSVALTPRVPSWSKVKLRFAPFLVEYVLGFPYLNPRWSEDPGLTRGKIFSSIVSAFHQECDVPACHMLSLIWGTGWPALYSHENLHEVTHRRGGDLYGGTAVHYYRHVRKMVNARNRAVKYDPNDSTYDSLPNDYLEYAKDIQTPVLFMTGENNRVFTDSNILCHQRLEAIVPGRHELHIFPNYGHQDVFMGKNCDRDIFPRLVEFLNKHNGQSQIIAQPEENSSAEIVQNNDQLGLTFRETMAGGFVLGETEPKAGEKKGKAENSSLAMHAAIDIRDLNRFISDPNHLGSITGQIDFTPWGENIPATSGVFNLFSPTDQPELKLMVYELRFNHEGQDYYLAGKKEVRDDPGFDLWADTTTLYTQLHQGTDKSAPVVGAGVLSLNIAELAKLVSTMRVTNADSLPDKTKALFDFGKFFLGELWDSYGPKE